MKTSTIRSGKAILAVQNQGEKSIIKSCCPDLVMQINVRESIIKSRYLDLVIQRIFYVYR